MNRKSPLPRLFYIFCHVVFSIGLANNVLSQGTQSTENDIAEKQVVQEEDGPSSDKDNFSEMTLDELSRDFTTKIRAYSKRYRAAPTKKEKSEVFKTIPKAISYKDRLVELINEDPGSEAGLEVIDWWYRRGGRREGTEIIMGLILKNYSELKTIEKYVPQIAWKLPTAEAKKQLRSLIEVNPFDSVKATATYQLYEVLLAQSQELEGEGEAAKTAQAEVKTLRDLIYDKYSDATDSRGTKYVNLLDAVEFANKLEIGQPVPDIVGTDLDGVDFKLTDYDGKVRVISFWGNW